MATFKFGRYIDIHWNGYDIQGPADTVFSIPDQLYEEFDADIAPVEPTLQWIDTNEFQSLSNSVSAATLSATAPITIASTSTGRIISFSSGTAASGYLLSADGAGGSIWNPASTSGLTSVVGIAPISSTVSGGVVSVSLNANYQTAGTYVTAVSGTAPITASGTTSITVGIDQTALSVADASTATTLRTYVKNSSGSTINKGQVVYITGADGTNALISLASASTDATSSKTLGIAANTMTNNAFGYVIEDGQLSGIDTSSATAGSSVWLGATPGSIVFNTPPAEPNHFVYLGVVTKANVSTGEILVKVQNGYELNELHDVFTTGVSSSLPLVYNATSDGWIAQALSSVGIADNAIVGSKILDGAVTSAKIADGSVTSSKIAAGAVGSAAIAANAVVAGDIAANAVSSGNIVDGSITSSKIAAAAVGTSAINSGSATSGQLLQANGSGGASFATFTSGIQQTYVTLTGTGTWTVPSGVKEIELLLVSAGGGGGSGALGAILSAPTAGSGASGGGGGGGGNMIYFPRFVIPSSTTSYTYSVATGGAGGAAISYSAITGSVKTAQLLSGNSGSNASGATTFGPDFSTGTSTGGGGGVVSTTGAPTAGSGGSSGTVNVPLYYINSDQIIVRSANGAAGGTVGSPVSINTSTTYVGEAVVTYYSRFSLSDLAGFDIGYGNSSTNIQSAPSISKTGAGSYTTSLGGRSLLTTAQSGGPIGGSGGGAGAALSTTPSAGSGAVSAKAANQSGCGNGAISAYFATSTVGTITASSGNGWNAVSFAQGSAGGGGGGGGSVAIYASSQANANAAGYILTSGSGGNGADGVIIIGYKQ